MRATIVLLALVSTFGCFTTTTTTHERALPAIPFDRTEHATYEGMMTGTGNVTGQVLVDGAPVASATKSTVTIFPATPYFRQWYDAIRTGTGLNAELDPQANEFCFNTATDAAGTFTFPKVKAGTYYLLSAVELITESRFGVTTVTVGDKASAKISLATTSRVARATVPGAYSGASAGGGGSVYVRGYTRKDGTYVRPHTRSRPR